MASITRALGRIETNLASILKPSHIKGLCQEFGHVLRNRILDPVTTLHLFILQILHGNTACSHLPRIAGQAFSASAYTQARSRLPLDVITALVSRIGCNFQQTAADVGLWKGHRTVLVDGSSYSMPDTPELQQHFGQHGR